MSNDRRFNTIAWLAAMVLLVTAAAAHSQDAEPQSACGPIAIPGHYGPYDYITQRGKLIIVEQHHFTPRVEALVAGQEGTVGGDISYTLNASPNHHRALVSLMRLGARTKNLQPPGVQLTIECYFDRAMRFNPKDTVARTLFGLYLAQINRREDAIKQFKGAAYVADDNAWSQNNIGLALFEVGEYELALQQAHKAAKLGFPPAQLEEKLRGANQWKDPTE